MGKGPNSQLDELDLVRYDAPPLSTLPEAQRDQSAALRLIHWENTPVAREALQHLVQRGIFTETVTQDVSSLADYPERYFDEEYAGLI